VHEFGARLNSDCLHSKVRQRAVSDRGKVVFAGIFLQQRDEFRDRVDPKVWVDGENTRLGDQLSNRRDVLAGIVRQPREKQRVDGERPTDAHPESRAIGCGLCDYIGTEIAAGARLILHDKYGGGIFLLQAVDDQARHDVRR
jgi:hypothetical protein